MIDLGQLPDIIRIMQVKFDRAGYRATLDEYRSIDPEDLEVWSVVVELSVELDEKEFAAFASGLRRHWGFLVGRGGIDSAAQGGWRAKPRNEWTLEQTEAFHSSAYRRVVEVRGPNGEILYVDPQGSNNAKYVGFPTTDTPEEAEALQPEYDFSDGVRGKYAAPTESVILAGPPPPPVREDLEQILECAREAVAQSTPHCAQCKRDMALHEIGDEFPEERVCDQCAGINDPSCVSSVEVEAYVDSLEKAKAADTVVSLEHDPSIGLEPLTIIRSDVLVPMTEEFLRSGRYHPRGRFCAYCEEVRGDEGVCSKCELACGDPCSRCDTGHGPGKHCPCCSPCLSGIKVVGTQTGRLSCKEPQYSNLPRTSLCARTQEAVDKGFLTYKAALKIDRLVAAGLMDPFVTDQEDDEEF